MRAITVALLLTITPMSVRSECTVYENNMRSNAPIVVPSVARLKIRLGPSTEAPVVASVARGHMLVVRQKCGDWIELESDRRVDGRITPFTGWASFPLTCTPQWQIRAKRSTDGAQTIIAPECPFDTKYP